MIPPVDNSVVLVVGLLFYALTFYVIQLVYLWWEAQRMNRKRHQRRLLENADVRRMRDDASGTTHRERYERANNALSLRVLDVPCPRCGSKPGRQCEVDPPRVA